MFCAFSMENPCVKKNTRPMPVFAPPRKDLSREGSNTKIQNPKDMIDISYLVEKQIEDEILRINHFEENNKNHEKKEHTPILKRVLENSSELTPRDNKKFKLNQEKLLNNTKVDVVLDYDLHLSDFEDSIDQSETNTKVSFLKGKKSFKTPSTVSPTPSELEELRQERSQKIQARPENKKDWDLILISPRKTVDGRTQCKHEYKKGEKKGEKCERFGQGDYCPLHKLKDDSISKTRVKEIANKNEEIQRKIEHLEDTILKQNAATKQDREKICKLQRLVSILRLDRERSLKLEKEVDTLKQTVRDIQSQNQEMSNKIDHILNNRKDKPSVEIAKSRIEHQKIYNLDKSKKYKLIKIVERDAFLEASGKVTKVKIPKGMENADQNKHVSDLFLCFNVEKKIFEWTDKP